MLPSGKFLCCNDRSPRKSHKAWNSNQQTNQVPNQTTHRVNSSCTTVITPKTDLAGCMTLPMGNLHHCWQSGAASGRGSLHPLHAGSSSRRRSCCRHRRLTHRHPTLQQTLAERADESTNVQIKPMAEEFIHTSRGYKPRESVHV